MVQPVILFDGVCNLCSAAVHFVIKRDKNAVFKFASLQSATASSLLAGFNLPSNEMRSIILIENNQLYSRSTAALRICRHLSAPWPLMYGFIIVPPFIRNFIYDFISKNRYRWFGKSDICMMPTPALQSRFLNDTL
jgi:predicted DCC family thiol-disulfide oxidoreductase YuxK